MLAGERGGGQHGERRVDVAEVLLGVHVEVPDTVDDGMPRPDPHAIVDETTRMADKAAADHELVTGVLVRRRHNAAVPAGEAGPAPDGVEEPVLLGRRQPAVGPALDDEVEGRQILVDIKAVGDGDVEGL